MNKKIDKRDYYSYDTTGDFYLTYGVYYCDIEQGNGARQMSMINAPILFKTDTDGMLKIYAFAEMAGY